MPGIQDLPPEVVDQVASYLPTARAATNLRQTSKRLRATINDHAWSEFVRLKFPSISIEGGNINDWKSVTHGLTTLSRNLDRKAFLARFVAAPREYERLPEYQLKWKLGRGQSMGYRPIIDSYEEMTGEHFWQRRDILAWGAGSQLAIRARNLDPDSTQVRELAPPASIDSFSHKTNWFLWKPPGACEGRDDITGMRLLPKHFQHSGGDGRIYAVYCTNRGQVALVGLPTTESADIRGVPIQKFVAGEGPVRDIAVSSPYSRLLAAAHAPNQNFNKLSLFTIPGAWTSQPIREVDSLEVDSPKNCGSLWSTEFLSENRLAIGVGPSAHQVYIYDVQPSGIAQHPLRKLSWTEKGTSPLSYDVVDASRVRKSSAYCIKPLPESSSATNRPGELFLTGGYDGIIRLLDLRSSEPIAAEYTLTGSESAIYSIATIGRERVVAGCAQHGAVTIFDVRVTGGRNYAYQNVINQSLDNKTNGSLIWLKPCSNRQYSNGKYLPQGRERWRRDWALAKSPVYSVSSPSPYSPFIYAGIENNVVELAFTSWTDKMSDPIFRPLLDRSSPNFKKQEQETFRDVLSFPMNDEENGRPRLFRQKTLAETVRGSGIEGYDERWEH